MQEKKVLILGGAGFIGSHLVELLLGKRNIGKVNSRPEYVRDVTVLDSFEYCYFDNLDSVKDRIKVVTADANNVGVWLKREAECGVIYDEIYHLAAIADTLDFTAQPIESFKVSVMPMLDILEYKMDINKDCKLLFTSSSEIYGEAEVMPTPESYNGNLSCDGVRSGYDEGKRAGETIIAGYYREYGISCTRVRIFNTYGERQRASGNLVGRMVHDALKYGEIMVDMPGNQVRTLLHVSDCVEMLVNVMEKQLNNPVNVGGVDIISVEEFAGLVSFLVKKQLKKKVRITKDNERYGDIKRRIPDISIASDMYGFCPRVSLEEGVTRVIEYWRNR